MLVYECVCEWAVHACVSAYILMHVCPLRIYIKCGCIFVNIILSDNVHMYAYLLMGFFLPSCLFLSVCRWMWEKTCTRCSRNCLPVWSQPWLLWAAAPARCNDIGDFFKILKFDKQSVHQQLEANWKSLSEERLKYWQLTKEQSTGKQWLSRIHKLYCATCSTT